MRPAGLSLRLRVTLAFGLLGALLSLMFAGATTFIAEHYEQVLVDAIVNDVARDLRMRHDAGASLQVSLPQTHMLKAYLRDAQGHGNAPNIFRMLSPGMHEFDEGAGSELRVGVFDLGRDRVYLAVDLGDMEDLETHLEQILAAIVATGTTIAAWLGWIFAGRTIAPVSRLAEAVEALPDQIQSTALAALVARDELGRLASAIDGYQRRLIDAETREQVFFANASHELRTPLAVILGSVELLLDDAHMGPTTRLRLQRLDRGAQTLADLLEVLLGHARGLLGAIERIDAEAWLRKTLVDTDVIPSAKLKIDNQVGHLHLRPCEAGLVVRGIVRRMLHSDDATTLEIEVTSHVLRFRLPLHSTRRMAPITHEASGDRGLGATLSGRLAAQIGWGVDESRLGAGEIHIVLPASQD